MTIEKAFELMNNLDLREPLRKYGPQWSSILVSPDGEILDVIRRKERPSQKMYQDDLNKYPNSVQFTARPGSYKTLDELSSKIRDCVWAHKNY